MGIPCFSAFLLYNILIEMSFKVGRTNFVLLRFSEYAILGICEGICLLSSILSRSLFFL